MEFEKYLENNIVYFDGGMGTLLYEYGMLPGEATEKWNISHPEIITDIHRKYYDAGSNVISTNTFGANSLKFSEPELSEIIASAVRNAKKARDTSEAKQEKFIALDIGPTGKLLKPLGDLDFEDAVEIFAKSVRLGVQNGVDLIIIETLNDCYETKAALLAAKENSDLPVIVSNAYGEDGKLMTGATPAAMVAMLEGMGADVIGANCSFGPQQLLPVAEELLKYASVPVLLQPNAGLPRVINGKTVFDVNPDEFSGYMKELVLKGLRVAGGCCGTTPEHIARIISKVGEISPTPVTEKNFTVTSSYTHAVFFDSAPVLIGERINPTGKKRFKQALIEKDMDYILAEGINQQDKGVHILDVNVGIPDINEKEMLTDTVCSLQAIIDLPLQIDTSDINAMESALRRYNGKAMINSVNGKDESMKAVFPLIKKYGGLVVALTLDENGIPDSADERFKIAEKIIKTAESYGISRKNLIFDTLAMTISADTTAANTTLNSLHRIRRKLGCHTSLGVSNISFGLPNRDAINSTFFAMALSKGLSAAIMNPYSIEMMKTYYTYNALSDFDSNCSEYIENADSFTAVKASAQTEKAAESFKSELQYAIIKGLNDKAAEVTKELLTAKTPLDIVNTEIIPALNEVGKGFENKTIYLPQLLMAAEASKSAFEVIKAVLPSENSSASLDNSVVIATVHGDVHDIGKNIVKLLLENYGFNVIDLGKDVPPETIVNKVIEGHIKLVGLSALMTTTVPAMEETIRLLRNAAPWCKIIVGGAVLTEDYANKIGADAYSADAMETVRYAQKIF